MTLIGVETISSDQRTAGPSASSSRADWALQGPAASAMGGSPAFAAQLATSPGDVRRGASVSSPQGPYQQFEAMVISQFVSTMLNAGGDSVFGEGTQMSAYTSIFADAIGAQIARHGGIGLAEAVAAAHPGGKMAAE